MQREAALSFSRTTRSLILLQRSLLVCQSRSRTLQKSLGAVVATTGIGGGLHYWYEDEGTRRAIKAFATFVPVVLLHYPWVEHVTNCPQNNRESGML
jgi:hypothetical protein